MTAKTFGTAPTPTFTQRLVALLATIDQGVTWWGEHRAWPANESARIETKRG